MSHGREGVQPLDTSKTGYTYHESYYKMAWQTVVQTWPIILGNILEWYEFSVYGYLESHLTKSFFYDNSVFTWLGFGVTFAARPFGGLVLGWVGDHYGRKTALLISLWGMIIATVGQGCLPTDLCCGTEFGYLGIGLLFILRIIQGICAGGEVAALSTYLSETVPLRVVGIANATISIGGNMSFFLASAMSAFLNYIFTEEQMDLWGWRIPFVICLPFGLLAVYLRKNLIESLHDDSLGEEDMSLEGSQSNEDQPLIKSTKTTLLGDHKMSLVISFIGATGISALWYVGPIYAPSWLDNRTTIDKSITLLMGGGAQLVALACNPFVGFLTDHYGVWKVTMVGNIAVVLTGLPVYFWLSQEPNSRVAGYIAISVLFGLAQGLSGTAIYLYCLELFPKHLRAIGLGVSYNLAVSYVGGFGPAISEAFVDVNELSAGFYTSAAGVVSIVGLILSRFWENGTTRKLTYLRKEPY